MISILMAFSSLTGGGMSSFVKEIVRSIDKDKYHIDLLVYEEGDPEITKRLPHCIKRTPIMSCIV